MGTCHSKFSTCQRSKANRVSPALHQPSTFRRIVCSRRKQKPQLVNQETQTPEYNIFSLIKKGSLTRSLSDDSIHSQRSIEEINNWTFNHAVVSRCSSSESYCSNVNSDYKKTKHLQYATIYEDENSTESQAIFNGNAPYLPGQVEAFPDDKNTSETVSLGKQNSTTTNQAAFSNAALKIDAKNLIGSDADAINDAVGHQRVIEETIKIPDDQDVSSMRATINTVACGASSSNRETFVVDIDGNIITESKKSSGQMYKDEVLVCDNSIGTSAITEQTTAKCLDEVPTDRRRSEGQMQSSTTTRAEQVAFSGNKDATEGNVLENAKEKDNHDKPTDSLQIPGIEVHLSSPLPSFHSVDENDGDSEVCTNACIEEKDNDCGISSNRGKTDAGGSSSSIDQFNRTNDDVDKITASDRVGATAAVSMDSVSGLGSYSVIMKTTTMTSSSNKSVLNTLQSFECHQQLDTESGMKTENNARLEKEAENDIQQQEEMNCLVISHQDMQKTDCNQVENQTDEIARAYHKIDLGEKENGTAIGNKFFLEGSSKNDMVISMDNHEKEVGKEGKASFYASNQLSIDGLAYEDTKIINRNAIEFRDMAEVESVNARDSDNIKLTHQVDNNDQNDSNANVKYGDILQDDKNYLENINSRKAFNNEIACLSNERNETIIAENNCKINGGIDENLDEVVESECDCNVEELSDYDADNEVSLHAVLSVKLEENRMENEENISKDYVSNGSGSRIREYQYNITIGSDINISSIADNDKRQVESEKISFTDLEKNVICEAPTRELSGAKCDLGGMHISDLEAVCTESLHSRSILTMKQQSPINIESEDKSSSNGNRDSSSFKTDRVTYLDNSDNKESHIIKKHASKQHEIEHNDLEQF